MAIVYGERPDEEVPIDWARDANFTSGPRSGSATKVEPSTAEKKQGFVPGFGFWGGWANWLLQLMVRWQAFFDARPLGLFGDGSDGDLTTGGNVTLTSDRYYNDLTVSAGDEINLAGYRLFVRGTLTLGSGSLIHCNGADGGNGAAGPTGGAGGLGAGGDTKPMGKGWTGGAGGSGAAGSNGSGSGTRLSLGTLGGNGGSGVGAGGTKGSINSGGDQRPRNAPAAIRNCATNISNEGETFVGGSGGGGGGSELASAGGGGGGGGGILLVCAREILGTGSIQARGGDGGDGYQNASESAGGGGGGGGGTAIVIYRNKDTFPIDANGGTGGTGIGPSGNDGDDGINGTAVFIEV